MALVSAQCPNCGANLQINNSNDAAICQYCGTPFVVEKAVNLLSISADKVNIEGVCTQDFEIYNKVLIKYHGKSIHPIIPQGVTEIGEFAFAGIEEEKKRTQTIKLLDEKTLKPYEEKSEYVSLEWTGTPIISVDIPDSVISINKGAFENCDKIKEIKIPRSVKHLGSYPFYNCTGKLILEDGINTLYSNFLSCSNFSVISIPNSIQEIEKGCNFFRVERIEANFPFTCNVSVRRLFRESKESRTFQNEKEMLKFLKK